MLRDEVSSEIMLENTTERVKPFEKHNLVSGEKKITGTLRGYKTYWITKNMLVFVIPHIVLSSTLYLRTNPEPLELATLYCIERSSSI